MLERNSATVTAHIDGLCASAATIVACHADKVVAAADGSYMIHPVSMGICDYLTADDLNNCLKALEAIRSNIITLYAKKSGKTEEECAKWMDETSWWTPAEAKEKGFVRSRVVDKTTAQPEHKRPAEQPENKTHGEVTDMDIKDIKTVDDLRKACPDLVAKIEDEAITAERTRIKEIEDATMPGAEDQANEAKFTKPVDSASFAKAMIASMKAKQQKQSQDYLDKVKKNAQDSGANGITNPPPANPEPEDAEEKSFMNSIRKANGVK